MEFWTRSALLLGNEKLALLQKKTVLVAGCGGVGSYAIEALARTNIGKLILIDFDRVDITNINRQLLALHSTIGAFKVDLAKTRLQDINPNLLISTYNCFIDKETIEEINFDGVDYIVDAIDNVPGKLLLIEKAIALQIPIISSMGTGNRLDPTKVFITDINKTSGCPLARIMRSELRKRAINKLTVLSSTELPIKHVDEIPTDTRKRTVGSIAFVPSVGGLLIAQFVIQELLK